MNSFDENFSASEIYCSHLLRQKRGFPLYVPAPQLNPEGVQIGDLGSVTPEGIFEVFFNIFLPPDGARTPEDFTPMLMYDLTDVLNHKYDAGDYVSTSTVQKMDFDPSSE